MMMARLIASIVILLPLLVWSQADQNSSVIAKTPVSKNANEYYETGIQWIRDLRWEQVKAKAKKENKFIFLDCYASWCGPCKKMDESVYSDGHVGRFASEKFICVKVQMDKTNSDDETIKAWYQDAKIIQSYYLVTAFPTYLFFSPDGKPLHKGVGYKGSEEFIDLMKDVFNPDKQYYRILKDFQPGKLDTAEMKGLAYSFTNTDKVLAGKIAADYLSRIPQAELEEEGCLKFMTQFSDNKEIRSIVASYLQRCFSKGFYSSTNLQLIKSFKNVSEIQNIVLDYLSGLDIRLLSKRENIELLRVFKGQEAAKEIANKVINDFREKDIYEWENIELLTDFTNNSVDRGFRIFYYHKKRVNDIVKKHKFNSDVYAPKDYAEKIVEKIISNEEMVPYLKRAMLNGEDVNWKGIATNIRKKYTRQIADRVILDGKISMYQYFTEKYNKHWEEFIKFSIEKIEKYGTDTTSAYIDVVVINNTAWRIFLHCSDEKYIKTAIKWMAGVVRRSPENDNNIDTYANLLYKIGKKGDAIQWEQKAMDIASMKHIDGSVKAYQNTISKMHNGEPTWETE